MTLKENWPPEQTHNHVETNVTESIRPAETTENKILTEISFVSKGYWDYPASYFDVWKNELTISETYILDNDVFVYETNEVVVGYYSIVILKKSIDVSGIIIPAGTWLEHMFILPEYIGQGIGRTMFNHLVVHCRYKQAERIKILADPNAKGFYEKIGCRYIEAFPSTIKGRTTPYLEFHL